MTEHLPQKIQSLIGVEVCYGVKEYGTIISAECSVSFGHEEWEVITDAGFSFSANQLLNLIAEIKACSSSYEEDNGRYQYIASTPRNSETKKFAWGNARPYSSGIISNIAVINGERINIGKKPG